MGNSNGKTEQSNSKDTTGQHKKLNEAKPNQAPPEKNQNLEKCDGESAINIPKGKPYPTILNKVWAWWDMYSLSKVQVVDCAVQPKLIYYHFI